MSSQTEDGIKGQAMALQNAFRFDYADLYATQSGWVHSFANACVEIRWDLLINVDGKTQTKVEGFNAGVMMITRQSRLKSKKCLPASGRCCGAYWPNPLAAKHRWNSQLVNLVPERFEAIWLNETVKLIYLEFELLHRLLQRHGQTVSPSDILKRSMGLIGWWYWNDPSTYPALENEVETRSPSSARYIKNCLRCWLLPELSRWWWGDSGRDVNFLLIKLFQ